MSSLREQVTAHLAESAPVISRLVSKVRLIDHVDVSRGLVACLFRGCTEG